MVAGMECRRWRAERFARSGRGVFWVKSVCRFGPRRAIHALEELAVGESGEDQQDYEVFASATILDRNWDILFINSCVSENFVEYNRAWACAGVVT